MIVVQLSCERLLGDTATLFSNMPHGINSNTGHALNDQEKHWMYYIS